MEHITSAHTTRSAARHWLWPLVWAEPYVIPPLALVPLFVPNPYRPAAAALGIVFLLLRWPVLGHVIRRTPLDWPLRLTVLGAVVGTLVSPVEDVSIERLWGYLGVVVLYYLIVTRRTDANLRWYMFWLVGGPLLLAGVIWGVTWAKDASSLTSVWQTVGSGEQLPGEVGRLFPHQDLVGGRWLYQQIGKLFPDLSSRVPAPNGVAGLFVIAFPFLLSGSLRGRRVVRVAWLLCALALAAALALTGSRGGVLALGAGFLGVVAAWLRRPWLAVWVLLLPIALLALAWIGPQSVPGLEIPDANGLSRIDLWQTSFYMVDDFTFTGVGLGAWPVAYKLLYAIGDVSVTNPHNLFLQVYLDLGPLGLIGLLWLILWGLRASFTSPTAQSRTRSWIRIGLAGAWLAFVVHGSFEASSATVWADGNTYHGIVSPIPWVLAALSVVLAGKPQLPHVSSEG